MFLYTTFAAFLLAKGSLGIPTLAGRAKPYASNDTNVDTTPTSISFDATPTHYSVNRQPAPRWQRFANIGLGPRQEHGVAATADDIYVVAGTVNNDNGTLSTITRVEVYNLTSERWSVAAPLPIPMNHPNVAAVDGQVYVLGGLSGGQSKWAAIRNAYVYHPSNDSWSTLPPMPNTTTIRGSSAIGVHGSRVYLAGGMTLLEPVMGGRQPSVADVSAFDTQTWTWNTELPALPAARDHVGGSVVNGTFYVLGGRDSGVQNTRDTVFALDLADPTAWRSRSPMPIARGSIAAAAVGSMIVTMGGEGNMADPNQIFHNVEVYDTAKDRWSELPPMDVARHGTGAAAVGGVVYVPGGGIRTASLPVGVFDALIFDGSN